MGLHTYEATVKVAGVEPLVMKIKAKKDQASRLASEISSRIAVWKWKGEILGLTTDEDKRPYYSMALYGHQWVLNEEQKALWLEDVNQFLAPLRGTVITVDDLKDIYAKLDTLWRKWVPIEDKRREPQAVENERLIHQAAEEQRNQKDHELAVKLGAGAVVSVPSDKLPITVAWVYDNSDTMSDYFDRDHHHGSPMLIDLVATGARTEAKARAAIAKYPALSDPTITWTWDRDKCRLTSDQVIGQAMGIKTYGGRQDPNCRFMIEFSTWRKELYTYAGYPGVAPQVQSTGAAEASHSSSGGDGRPAYEVYPAPTMAGATCVKFADKPSASVLAPFQKNGSGWRWWNTGKCWYIKRAVDTAYVQQLIGY
jgi:hypothetical protein